MERGEFGHEDLDDAELIVSALFEGLGKIFFDDSGRLVEDTRAMKEERPDEPKGGPDVAPWNGCRSQRSLGIPQRGILIELKLTERSV